FVLAGPGFGKVRAMTNEHGKQVHEAEPATPVEILGLSDVPNAGDPLHAVKDPKKAQEIAESRKVKRDKSLITTDARISLDAVDDVKSAMEGLLPTTKVEKSNGKAEVRQIFKIRGVVVAGCYVIEGKIVRTGNARLLRDNAVMWDGKLIALKRFKDDAKEVAE